MDLSGETADAEALTAPHYREIWRLKMEVDFVDAHDGESITGDDWDNRSADELAGRYLTGIGFNRDSFTNFGSQFTDVTLSQSYDTSVEMQVTEPNDPTGLGRALGDFPGADGGSNSGFANLPGASGNGFVFNVYIKQDALAFDAPLYLNMLCADYDAVTPRVRLTFAPNLGVDPVVTCFDMDPLSLDGQIQRASIPITGEALRCTPYDEAQSVEFGDVFQLETILGENYWHGYVKVDFLDPWDGVNPESYMAIDFIELAVNKDSLGGFGVNPEDRRFEEIRIGDIDGFGWGDGAALAAHDPAVTSANDDLVNLPSKLPINRDGFGLLASGDLLPDIDGDGAVENSATGHEPADDWDRRSGEEVAGTYYTGTGFTRSAESFFELGSQYTDITLSKSYTASSGEADPVLTGNLERAYGAYPATDRNSNIGSNLPGQNNNHPFYFNFYVDPFAIDPEKPLYLTMTHGDLDTTKIEVELRDLRANSATATLMAAGTTDDGAVESSFVVLDETTLEFDDIFTWDASRNKWHGYLEVRFKNIGTSTDEYFAIDFLELSTSQKNIAVPGAGSTIRVPEDFDTIQAAIDIAQDGNTILVAPGTYRENLDMLGKNIVLRSHDPLDPSVVATTIIDGDVDNDTVGDGSVIMFRGSESDSAIRGFTIQNGDNSYGGGILGYGTTATIEHNVIKDNKAAYGGGIAMVMGNIRYNEILNNEAYIDTDVSPTGIGVGGGIYNCGNLWQNNIHENTAAVGGGGVWQSGMVGYSQIMNNLIHKNAVSDTSLSNAPGVGIHRSPDALQAVIVHNTLVDNTWNGLTVNMVDETEAAWVRNNILWDTTGLSASPDTDWDRLQEGNVRFNLMTGAPTDGSDPLWNIGNDPLLVNAVGEDYTLEITSPAIDAGVELIPPVLIDYENGPRLPETPDVGAYEWGDTGASPVYILINGDTRTIVNKDVHLTTHLSETLQTQVNGGSGITWQWKRDGVNISGATSSTLTLSPVVLADDAVYTAIATIGGTPYTSFAHDLYVEPAQANQHAIRINEIMVVNTNGITDGDDDHVAWVELYNEANAPVDLTDWGFNVSPTSDEDTRDWTFPSVTIGAESHLLVFVSGKEAPPIDELHALIDLDPAGGTLVLLNKIDEVMDVATFGPQEADVSWSLFPGGWSYSNEPSPDDSNTSSTGAGQLLVQEKLSFGFCPPEDYVDETLTIYNVGGANLTGQATILSGAYSFVYPTEASYNIAPGASHTIWLRFAPTEQTPTQGVLDFNSGLKQTALTGNADSFDVFDYIMGDVYISEIVTNNVSGFRDEDDDASNWVELHNRGTSAVSLLNWELVYNETVWTFPDVQILPNQYIVVFTSGKNRLTGELHTNFTTDNGEDDYLALRKGPNTDDVVSRHYPLPVNEPDTSYELFSSGMGSGMFAYGLYGFTQIQTPEAAHFISQSASKSAKSIAFVKVGIASLRSFIHDPEEYEDNISFTYRASHYERFFKVYNGRDLVRALQKASRIHNQDLTIISELGIFSHGDDWGIGADPRSGFYSDNINGNDIRNLKLQPGAATFLDLERAIQGGTVNIVPATKILLNACRASRGVQGQDKRFYNWAHLLSRTTKCIVVGGVGQVGPLPAYSGWFMADLPTQYDPWGRIEPADHYHDGSVETIGWWFGLPVLPEFHFQSRGTWEIWNNGRDVTPSLDEVTYPPYLTEPGQLDNWGRNKARLWE